MTGIGFLSPTDKPSFDILRRWIILSLKWPSVIRWLYWTPGGKNSSTQNETNKNNVIRERLLLLENTARECKDQSSWQKEIEYKLHIKATEVTWITDEALRAFFNDEGTIADPNERISSKIGKGLY